MRYLLVIPLVAFVLLAMPLLVLGSYWRLHPEGKYNSYALYQHDSADTVVFHDGVVTHSTCCGQSDWGTYRMDGGALEWDWQYGKPFRHLTARVVPGWFGATVVISGLKQEVRVWVRRKLTESTVL